MSRNLHPFSQLTESLPALRDVVTTFTNLANKTVDLNAVTDHAFQPAVANWEGICSAELRDLRTHPKQKAEDAGSHLAWTAVALQFWVSKVDDFNEAVATLETLTDDTLQRNYYGKLTGNPSDEQIYQHAANVRRDAHLAYQRLVDDQLDTAARQTAGMFQHPFSEHNLRLARDAGAIPATPGAFSVFPALWHRDNMTKDAAEAERLVNDLTSDGRISDENLKRLKDLLSQDADDPQFAFTLLDAIGPHKLLKLDGDVALQTKSWYDLDDVDRDKAAWIGAIQTGLGGALATATRTGNIGHGQVPAGTYSLGPEWTDELIRDGKKRFDLDTPNGVNRFYGYQLMAPLLEHGDYSPEVLAKIGGSMIDFEREHHGSDVWWNESGDRKHFMDSNIRLDWTNGYGHHDPAGFDPMNALTNALNHNATATQEIFAPQARHANDDPNSPVLYYSSARLNYMLSDRTWLLDLPAPGDGADPGRDWHAVSFDAPGLATLGQALEHATTRTFDQNEVALASATVHAVGRSDHLAPELTKPMANLASVYIYEINRGVAPQFAGPAPGHGAVFSHNDTVDFLKLVGENREANATIRAAEAKWAGDNYLNYLGGPGAQGGNADRILHTQQTSSLYGKVAGLLDSMLDEQYRERVTAGGGDPDSATYRIGSFLLDEGLDKVKDSTKEIAPVPPIVVDAASELIKEGYAHIFGAGEKSSAELEAQIRHHTRNTLFHGQDLSASLASNAIYESGILNELPARYYVDGHLKPMSQFTASDWVQWQGGMDPLTGNVVDGYINGGGQDSNGTGEDAKVIAQQAADAYMEGYNQAKNI